MKLNSNTQMGMLCLFIIVASIATIRDKKTALKKQLPGLVKALTQIKRNNGWVISVRLLPSRAGGINEIGNNVYNIRITLKSNEPVKQALMGYMNFGIKNAICVIQGGDTLSCMFCERIPGITRNEFLYATGFNKPVSNASDGIFRVCITDTIVGFGIAAFEIDPLVLKNYAN